MTATVEATSFRRICMDFAIANIVAIVGVLVLGYALLALFDYDSGSGLSLVPVLVAALYAGQKYAGRTRARPPSGFAWMASVWMALTGLVISVMAFGALIMALGVDLSLELSALFGSQSGGTFLTVVAIAVLIQFLVIRFFFGMGAKQTVKAQEKETLDKF
ncbi:MAG: ABZJ_00895 family protein [Pseudomonadota bacterium]